MNMQMHILGCGNAKSLSVLRITCVVDKRARPTSYRKILVVQNQLTNVIMTDISLSKLADMIGGDN